MPAPSALSPSYRSLRFSQCPPHLDATLSHRRFNYTLLSTARGPYATASTRDTVAGCHPPRPFRTPWRHRATARYPLGSKRAKATQRHPGVNGGHACSGPHHGRVIKLRSGRSIGQFQQRSGVNGGGKTSQMAAQKSTSFGGVSLFGWRPFPRPGLTFLGRRAQPRSRMAAGHRGAARSVLDGGEHGGRR